MILTKILSMKSQLKYIHGTRFFIEGSRHPDSSDLWLVRSWQGSKSDTVTDSHALIERCILTILGIALPSEPLGFPAFCSMTLVLE